MIDPNKKVEELIELYKNPNLNHQEQAAIEEAIWRKMHTRKDGVERRDLLKEILGIPYRTSETHSVLLRAGSLADILWEELNHNTLTLNEAQELMRISRMRWKNNKDVKIEDVLAEILRIYKKDANISLPTLYKIVTSSPQLEKKETEWVETNAFWQGLKVNLGKFLDAELAIMNPITAHEVRTRVESLLREAIQEAKGVISREMEKTKGGKGLEAFKAAFNMEEVENACHLLGISAPEFGDPVDLHKAKMRKKNLARSVSTDLNSGGADASSEKYKLLTQKHQAVNAAYKLLEQYNEMLAS
jgi:hypothetical protein